MKVFVDSGNLKVCVESDSEAQAAIQAIKNVPKGTILGELLTTRIDRPGQKQHYWSPLQILLDECIEVIESTTGESMSS